MSTDRPRVLGGDGDGDEKPTQDDGAEADRDRDQEIRVLSADLERRAASRAGELATASRQAVETATAVRDLGIERLRAHEAEAEGRGQFAAIFNGSHDVFLLVSPDGEMLDVNPAAEELTGSTAVHLRGKKVWDLATPETRERQRAVWAELTGVGTANGELEIARSDGSIRFVEYRAVANIAPNVHLSVLRDVTDRKKTDEALANAQRLESVGILAAGVAHDFNNLLVAILGNADLALDSLHGNAPAEEAIEQVKAAARRAADLARQMLAVSGRTRLIVQPVDVNELVPEMLQLVTASISRSAKVVQALGPDVPAIGADGTQVRQIIMNLVVNASDAIGSAPGVITISTGSIEADRAYLSGTFLAPELPVGRYVYLDVEDTGSGMDASTQKRIFDPFFSTKPTGRGLGLAAVLGIVRAHNGAIRVSSEWGHGTTFRVLLPALLESSGHGVFASNVEPGWRGSGTVLLADDEPLIRATLTRVLEGLGFTVIVTEDGQEAVDAFRARGHEIVLVMLDLRMPRLGGDAASREIRRIAPGTKIIMMSGLPGPDSGDWGADPAVGFLHKPFEVSMLRNVLQSALGDRHTPMGV